MNCTDTISDGPLPGFPYPLNDKKIIEQVDGIFAFQINVKEGDTQVRWSSCIKEDANKWIRTLFVGYIAESMKLTI